MNFKEIRNAVRHLLKTSICGNCKDKYEAEDISIIATTRTEGLFEMKCSKCNSSTIVTVFLAPKKVNESENIQFTSERHHQTISQNDVLDMKNFLNTFDGNFKKIFINEP